MSTSNNWAIRVNVDKSGCEVFVHHLDTVAGFFPRDSASHLLVFFLSTRTTLILFISSIALNYIALNANIIDLL